MNIDDSAIAIARNQLKAAEEQAAKTRQQLEAAQRIWNMEDHYRIGIKDTLLTLGLF